VDLISDEKEKGMALPQIDLTTASGFELVELRSRIATEQDRRNRMEAAQAQLSAAMEAFLTAGGCSDDLVTAIRATETPTDPEPDQDQDPGSETGDDSGEGGYKTVTDPGAGGAAGEGDTSDGEADAGDTEPDPT
jgi:hypothetical protein